MKAQIKNHLSLTKKEWNGMVVLVILIVLVLCAPYAYQWLHKDSTINPNDLKAALAQFNKLPPVDKAHHVAGTSLYKFDPNNLPPAQWQQLGLSAKQISIIKNYEAKGGRFYKATDLKKIYGITPEQYSRLEPYIAIKSRFSRPAAIQIIELNTADSAQLTTVEGIGPAFAKRIINYRKRLGGFVKKEQLKEVFGLDELKFNEIQGQVKADASRIRKIDINHTTFDKLRLMPYLNYKQVNAIIEYRNQHGNFSSVEDVANIVIVDDGVLRKIEPYLTFK